MDNKTQQLNAIVGEALKALVEIGVAPDQVGAFAISYPPRAAVLLGQGTPESEVVDLEELIHRSVVKAMRAANTVLEKATSDAPKTRINVVVQGKRTSVTIRKSMVEAATEARGSQVKGKALIQDLAATAPVDVVNRSAWTEEALHSHLVLLQSKSQGMAH